MNARGTNARTARAPASASICQQNRRMNICKDCRGASITSGQCKDRNSANICEHKRRRSKCKDCGGASICEHNRRRSACKDCRGTSICEHNRERSACKDCGCASICEHNRRSYTCKVLHQRAGVLPTDSPNTGQVGARSSSAAMPRTGAADEGMPF